MRDSKWKQAIVTLTVAFAIAVGVNWAILWLFGQKSGYRAEHSLVGIILLMAYASVFMDKKGGSPGPIRFFLIALVPCYLGTVFPDLDITLFGIGGHRNPLFHSSLSYFLWFVLGRGRGLLLRTGVIGYGVGLASHLEWDALDHADVRWLPGGLMDRLWLVSHGLFCFIPPNSRRKNSTARFSAQ